MPVTIRASGGHFRTYYPVAALYVSGLLAITFLFGLSSPLKAIVTQHVAAALETRIPRFALQPTVPVSGMIVLGGGPTRVPEAVKLAKVFPDARIILSGPGQKEVSFLEINLPDADNLIVDHRARNTYENAVFSHELANQQQGECWILITSAMHMPRALASFRTAGMSVAPWPVLDTPESDEELAKWVQHEVLGLLGYWLVGRTREILPAHRSPVCPSETGPNRMRISSAEY